MTLREYIEDVFKKANVTPPFQKDWVTDFFKQGHSTEDFESLLDDVLVEKGKTDAGGTIKQVNWEAGGVTKHMLKDIHKNRAVVKILHDKEV